MSFNVETFDQERAFVDWVILENGERWTNCIRRFHQDLLGSDVDVHIRQVHHHGDLRVPTSTRPTVFLLEVGTSNFVDSLDTLTQKLCSPSNQLWLIACNRLSLNRRLVLGELNIAGFLEQPENILRFKPILDGYFARVF
ncbi:MAG: hypothetical protein L7U72_14165 [Rubripirellula sp.]|nr:hypothetical protein [Rubripirellula sp.]